MVNSSTPPRKWLRARPRTYSENGPYLLPAALGELVGPKGGVVQLPLRLDWSERTEFHLGDPAERNVMYERVIREATRVDDLRSYLNAAVLRQVWRQLFLPARVRPKAAQPFTPVRAATYTIRCDAAPAPRRVAYGPAILSRRSIWQWDLTRARQAGAGHCLRRGRGRF